MKKLMCIAVFMFLIAIPGLIFAEPGIRITQPLDGAVVTSGQEINVSIEPTDGFVTRDGKVIILFNKSIFDKNPVRSFLSLPATFTFKINKDAVGETTILAFATSKSKKIVEDQIKIICQPEANLQGLKTNADKISVYLEWNNNIRSFYPNYIFVVEGIYSDGITRDLKNAGYPINYESSDPSIVSIDSKGKIQVYKKGEAHLIVSSSGFSVDIPLVFEEPSGIKPSETIPPTTNIEIRPQPNTSGWNNSNVTITLTAKDNEGGFGVEEIQYNLRSGGLETVKGDTAIIAISNEGEEVLNYAAVDKERNYDISHAVSVRLDKTPPQISLELKTISLSEGKKEKEKGKEEDEGNWYKFIYSAKDNLSGLKDTQAGLTIINLSGFKQELEVDNELEIEIDEKKKEIKIEAPDPQSVLEELKDSLFNIANNQNLQLKIKQGEPKWKLKQKTQGFEIQAPSIIFKAIASDIADNTAIKELEFKKEKKKDKD